jgi:hypothetical protein
MTTASNSPVLLVCGGLHPPGLTGAVVAAIAADPVLGQLKTILHSPATAGEVLSPRALGTSLEAGWGDRSGSAGLILWAFSAGCVGAAGLATHWQRHRGEVLALFLVDGWGVPRDPAVPTYRLSHDRFTHTTSRWLGRGDEDFYAAPAVPHLRLWQRPQGVKGWAVGPDGVPRPTTAADFLQGRSRACLRGRR